MFTGLVLAALLEGIKPNNNKRRKVIEFIQNIC
jgi:hypothetical protein